MMTEKDMMSNFEQQFHDNVTSNHLWDKGDLLLLACSGGIDSVVLAWLLKKRGLDLELLHCNFKLREMESDRDEAFVRSLAAELGVSINVITFETKKEMLALGKGVQETARILRYKWFDEMANLKKTPSRKAWVLLAHHHDDQVETISMNFFRGTGLPGLLGMKPKFNQFVRPLLPFSRQQILEYANANGIKWVEDSSNSDTHYTRNHFRNEVLPAIRKVFPELDQNIVANARRFEEVNAIYQERVQQQIRKLLVKTTFGWKIPLRKLMHVTPMDTLLYELFRQFGFSADHCMEIKKLFTASSGRSMNSNSYSVLKNREWLYIAPLTEMSNSIVVIEASDQIAKFAEHQMRIAEVLVDNLIHSDQHTAYIRKRELTFPLILRPWKEGDYFYPLGMKKKKKLSRFLTDLKLSKFEKDQQWILESNKRIIWVVGRRIDERFKVRSASDEVLMFNY